jgi:hypothetical protein
MLKLQSIPDSAVMRTLTSSGTTSQQVSRIAIDASTSQIQTRGLGAIVTSFIGTRRLPMIIIDASPRVKKKTSMSARGAGILGLATFGRDHFYALDESLQPDIASLQEYLEKYRDQPMLIFGFTFMIWLYFYQMLRQQPERFNLENAVLIHGGGWKKMQQEGVGNDKFKAALHEQFGIQRVHSFYGMVEQVGSIYMECEAGYLHASNFSEILIRDHTNWEVLPPGQSGLIQTMSVFARSYPGHSLLTEDIGVVEGIDDCTCGRKGTYFTVVGRAPQAELRGCSDTRIPIMTGAAQ